MPATHPRIQVTVDDELADALHAVQPTPSSRSRLVRDLALRGAEAVLAERGAREEALTVLLEIADGVREYDLEAVREVIAMRDEHLP